MAPPLHENAVLEAVGNHLQIDMAPYWQPDDGFFDLLQGYLSGHTLKHLLSAIGCFALLRLRFVSA